LDIYIYPCNLMKGLFNLGNTCYFNSALQCLLQTPIITNTYLKYPYIGTSEFTQEYQNIVRKFWTDKDPKPLNVLKLINLFRGRFKQFTPGWPQDAQEATICILDILDVPFTKFDLIQETVCPFERTKHIEKMVVYTGLLEGTEKWASIENFEDSNGTTHPIAATRTLFWTLPKVFILSLTVKMEITLGESLDLLPYMHPESPDKLKQTKYELYATCIHQGSQNGGHYAALTKHKGQWYLKDDDAVSKVIEFPNKCGHYVMFFKPVLKLS